MSRETITREEGAFCRTNIIITKGKLTMSQLEIIISEGCTYARKKPGESFNAYACAFCSRLVSYTTVQPNRSQEKRFLGIRCELCGHAFPRRARNLNRYEIRKTFRISVFAQPPCAFTASECEYYLQDARKPEE